MQISLAWVDGDVYLSGVNFQAESSFCVSSSFVFDAESSVFILSSIRFTAGSSRWLWRAATDGICEAFNTEIWD